MAHPWASLGADALCVGTKLLRARSARAANIRVGPVNLTIPPALDWLVLVSIAFFRAAGQSRSRLSGGINRRGSVHSKAIGRAIPKTPATNIIAQIEVNVLRNMS